MPTAPFRRAAVSLALTLGLVGAGPAPHAGAAEFPTPERATVHPGVLLVTDGKGCTANFVFTDAAGHFYLGQAAHCASRGDIDEFNGCTDEVLPLGTEVAIRGSRVTGTLAYNSWTTMQAVRETDPNVCRTNDFALVRLPDSAAGQLNPSVPYFGGPTALGTEAAGIGELAYAYGNAPTRQGIAELSPKRGTVLKRTDEDWTYLTYFVTPVIPGDSGSGVLDEQGRALGVASSLVLLPYPAANGVVSLALALAYAQKHSGIKGLRLVPGTEPFRGS
jgi:hypothetical protein